MNNFSYCRSNPLTGCLIRISRKTLSTPSESPESSDQKNQSLFQFKVFRPAGVQQVLCFVRLNGQSTIDEYCSQYSHPDLELGKAAWQQIDYFLSITQPFFTLTTSLSKTKEVIIHSVLAIYNTLFSHLEKSMAQLACAVD